MSRSCKMYGGNYYGMGSRRMYGGQNETVKGGLTSTEILAPAGIGTIAGLASRNVGVGLAAAGGTLLAMKALNIKGGRSKRSKNRSKRSPKRRSTKKSPKRWIQGVVSGRKFKSGSFTRQAKAAGMSTKAFMRHVLAHPTRYSVTTRRRAQFLKNIQRSK